MSTARESPAQCPESSHLDDDFGPFVEAGSTLTINIQKTSSLTRWRRGIGLVLLATAVTLWTAMSFLASSILADHTYSRPYFVTLINSSLFILPLITILIRHAHDTGYQRSGWSDLLQRRTGTWKLLGDYSEYESGNSKKLPAYQLIGDEDRAMGEEHLSESADLGQSLMSDSVVMGASSVEMEERSAHVTLGETIRLAAWLFIPWSNYTVVACLEYTTVASATVLGATSSIWTLIIGFLFRIERFTLRSVLSVVFSFLGILMISSTDVSNSSTVDESGSSRGTFPPKTPREILIGDVLAVLSVIFGALYTVFMKVRLVRPGPNPQSGGRGGSSSAEINVVLLLSFTGLFCLLFLSPFLVPLHLSGIEPFKLPPARGKVPAIIAANAIIGVVAEISWAGANLLTSPLTVTVGLATGIPLAIVGEMILHSAFPSLGYWIGAGIVLLGFFLVWSDGSDGDGANSR